MSIEYTKLYKFIESTDEIMSYMEKLMKTIELKDKENQKESLEKLQELGASYVEKTKHLESIMEEMNNKGLYFTDESVFYFEGYTAKYEENSNEAYKKFGHYSFDHNDEYCGYHDAEWKNEDRISYPTAINGCNITKRILDDEANNHTSQKEYEKWLKENSSLNTELEKLKEEITKDLDLLNKKIFGKKQIKERLSTNKEKLLELNNKKEQGDHLKEKATFYESLDSEKRSLIIDYLDSLEECNSISNDIRDSIFSTNVSCKEKMVNHVDTLIEEAINNGLVTPEEVEKYNYILMNIDLSNIEIDKIEERSYETGAQYWRGSYYTKRLINSYCHKIISMKAKKNYEELAKIADTKVKKITK